MTFHMDRAKRPDNTGGYDYAIANEKGEIIAEFFEHVAHDKIGGYVKLPAREHAEIFLAAMNVRPTSTERDVVGTYTCPICGLDKPHHHPDEQVLAYREDQIRRDGWTSAAHRQPKESGWYLCFGVEVNPDQYGKKKDFWTANERWSQLSWFIWVREAGSHGVAECEIPEVLYFDRNSGWKLRAFLGNAIVSGAESRFPVYAKPKYWRDLLSQSPPPRMVADAP